MAIIGGRGCDRGSGVTFCLLPLVSDFTRVQEEADKLSFGGCDHSGLSCIEHVGMVLEQHSWVLYSGK